MTGETSFKGLWDATLGSGSAWLVDLSIALMCLSAAIIYAGILGDTATSLLRDAATWPDACAEAVAARRAARAASHHPDLVPLSRFGAQDAATVYGPLFFPLVTCVCSALWHEVQHARGAKRWSG